MAPRQGERVAWGEVAEAEEGLCHAICMFHAVAAVDGNIEIQKWLVENDYEELVHASYAIRLKEDSRTWLMDNGYAHLMAMINGCEGNTNAQKWLLDYGFLNLYHVARAIDYEQDSLKWLAKKKLSQLAILVKSIQRVKDKIEETHNDIHSMNKD